MSLHDTLTAPTHATLPDPVAAGFADRFYRFDGGHSLANDESLWTPGENVGRSIAFSSTCWLMQHGSKWLLWDTGVPESALHDPKGWSTLPKLIVYHLNQTLTDQLATIETSRHQFRRDIAYGVSANDPSNESHLSKFHLGLIRKGVGHDRNPSRTENLSDAAERRD